MSVLQQLSEDLEVLVARVTPAVVAVEHSRGHGTGTALTDDGYVLTNHHVVRDRQGGVRVRFADGRDVGARVVGVDPRTDLAVLRVDARSLATLPLAKASDVKVGQIVVAVGNPLRFERSVSLGVVSAIDRFLPGPGGSSLEGLIQTDAAINPGNSGGPLVNVHGAVVGISTAIIPYAQGIGFAVPAATAQWVAGVLMKKGTIERPYVGIAARGEQLAPALAQMLGGQSRGVRVITVGNSTPAAAAGLRDGDVLFACNDEPIGSVDELQRVMVMANASEVRVAYVRDRARREAFLRPRMPVAFTAA